jgi:hypothetical protein
MKLLLTAGFMLVSMFVHSQSFEMSSLVKELNLPRKVQGVVVDDANNKTPLAFASVVVSSSNISVDTDLKGLFDLKLMPGHYTIEVEFIGYKNTVIKNIEVTSNSSQFIEIFLGPETISSDLVLANYK